MNGILSFSSIDELNQLLSDMTEESYTSKLTSIKENFHLAQQFDIPEDWMYLNILSELKL